MRLIIIKSILGNKEKSKIDNKIKSLLSISDYDRWYVVNETDRDLILTNISISKIEEFEMFLKELGVLVSSSELILNDILDKIHDTGINSLNNYEKKYLTINDKSIL